MNNLHISKASKSIWQHIGIFLPEIFVYLPARTIHTSLPFGQKNKNNNLYDEKLNSYFLLSWTVGKDLKTI